MTVDPVRLARIRRLHRVQASLTRREDMRQAALEAARLSLLGREVETVARFGSDEAFGPEAGDLRRRLAVLSARRRGVEEEARRQQQRVVEQRTREAVIARRLALLDAAAADEARRAELNGLVEARLSRAMVMRRNGGRVWRST